MRDASNYRITLPLTCPHLWPSSTTLRIHIRVDNTKQITTRGVYGNHKIWNEKNPNYRPHKFARFVMGHVLEKNTEGKKMIGANDHNGTHYPASDRLKPYF